MLRRFTFRGEEEKANRNRGTVEVFHREEGGEKGVGAPS